MIFGNSIFSNDKVILSIIHPRAPGLVDKCNQCVVVCFPSGKCLRIFLKSFSQNTILFIIHHGNTSPIRDAALSRCVVAAILLRASTDDSPSAAPGIASRAAIYSLAIDCACLWHMICLWREHPRMTIHACIECAALQARATAIAIAIGAS